eukprot:436977-Pelagomonas_calceolata.AAC.1
MCRRRSYMWPCLKTVSRQPRARARAGSPGRRPPVNPYSPIRKMSSSEGLAQKTLHSSEDPAHRVRAYLL